MNILVCVKRVPATGGRIILTADAQAIDTRFLGFMVSPHEECAVEEAVRIVEAHGGTSAVLTLGPEPAADQLRDAMAIGIDRAILLETDGRDWDPSRPPAAIVDAIRGRSEAADGRSTCSCSATRPPTPATSRSGSGSPPRSGCHASAASRRSRSATGWPSLGARRGGGWEVFELPLPAVVAVREGINLPRYPSVPGPPASQEEGDRADRCRRAGRAA